MATNEKWAIGRNEERFGYADFASREEAIAGAADELGLSPGEAFFTCRAADWMPVIDGASVLEQAGEDAHEDVGDIADRWPPKFEKKDVDDLGKRLTAVLHEWLREQGAMPSFFRAADVQQHTVPEADPYCHCGAILAEQSCDHSPVGLTCP